MSCLGHIAQWVVSLTAHADQGVASSIRPLSHTYFRRDNDHEIISTVILLLPHDSRRVFVSYKRRYAHEVLRLTAFQASPGKRVR